MLAGIKSVGFKVENFDKINMGRLEKAWPAIKSSLLLTAELVASFGFSGKTLRADSALLPIASYLFHRNLSDDYLSASKYRNDRKVVRLWLIRSYLKASGIWGSGLDTLLTALRDVLRDHGKDGFPTVEIENEMKRRGKSLDFSSEEVEDLTDEPYGSDRCFALLSLLFDAVDTAKNIHVDHIFPISRFTPSRLTRAGIPHDKHVALIDFANSLPNLQLLEGVSNQEKLTSLPRAWIESRFKSQDDQQRYISIHDLGDVPSKMVDFEDFALARRVRLKHRIEKLIN